MRVSEEPGVGSCHRPRDPRKFPEGDQPFHAAFQGNCEGNPARVLAGYPPWPKCAEPFCVTHEGNPRGIGDKFGLWHLAFSITHIYRKSRKIPIS